MTIKKLHGINKMAKKENTLNSYTKDLFEFSKSEVRKFFRLSPKERERTYIQVTSNSTEDFSFYLLTVLSSLIISLGMLVNNSAVVIGGMLIAPLIWPILSFSIAVTSGKLSIVRHSLFTVLKASFLVLIVAALVGLISPFTAFTEEILSRTAPTFIELLIGLTAGFVGAYTVSSVKLSSIIGGVAVAVALVPPLCVAGLTLIAGDTDRFLGAALLFASNLLAIAVGSVFLYMLQGFFTSASEATESVRKSYLFWSFILLLTISIPLFVVTRSLISQNQMRNFVYSTIREYYPSAKITELNITKSTDNENILIIDVTLQYQNTLEPEKLEELNNLYSHKFNKGVVLNTYEIPIKTNSVRNYTNL